MPRDATGLTEFVPARFRPHEVAALDAARALRGESRSAFLRRATLEAVRRTLEAPDVRAADASD